MTKSKPLFIQLKFDAKEGRWDAFIDGELYGQHRWEKRAFAQASANYIEAKNIPPKDTPTFEPDIQWPPQMKKAFKIFNRSQRAIQELEEALKRAKEEHDIVCAQYMSAWRDCGLSKAGAVAMLKLSNNTAQGYIDRAGGPVAAAQAMWKKAGVKSCAGMLERSSPRTNPSTAKTTTTVDGTSPFYENKPK